MSAALVFGSMSVGCGDDCDQRCDRLIKCVKDMSGGKLKKNERRMKKECSKQCNKDKKKFNKGLKQICGK